MNIHSIHSYCGSYKYQILVKFYELLFQILVTGIKNMTPLMKLDSSSNIQDLVEISDSESDGEDSEPQEQQQPKEKIGEEVAK